MGVDDPELFRLEARVRAIRGDGGDDGGARDGGGGGG
jgi:hypothetical protein